MKALMAFLVFFASSVALASGKISVRATHVPESGDNYYLVGFSGTHQLFGQKLEYVGWGGTEYHDKFYDANYLRAEQGLDSVWGPVVVGAGVAGQVYTDTMKPQLQLYGTLAWTIWP